MTDTRPDWYVRHLRQAAETLRATVAERHAFEAANPPAPGLRYYRGGHSGGTVAGFQRF